MSVMRMLDVVLIDEDFETAAPPPPRPAKGYMHTLLKWLDDNVRQPLAGTVFDTHVATPAKNMYNQTTKQS